MKRNWKKPGSLFSFPAKPKKPKKKFWWPLAFIGRQLRRMAMFTGTMVLIMMVVSCTAGMMSAGSQTPLPSEMVLTLRVDRGLSEYSPDMDFLREFYGAAYSRVSAQEIVDAIDRATEDQRVKSLVFVFEGGPFDIAQVQDVRASIKKFRAAGKKTFAYSPSYAEAGGGMGAYYLASAFDEIWMQPVGMVDITGFDASGPFFKGFFDKWGVKPQFYQRKEYKSVMENLTRSGLSAASREMMDSLLGDLMNQMDSDISADRSIAFRTLVNGGLFMDQAALDAKLVDHLGSYEDVIKSARGEKGKIKSVTLARYRNQTMHKKSEQAATVGILYVNGAIVADDQSSGFGGGADMASAKRIADAIMRTVRDRSVDAIIMRVNSPGGSPTASETIRRAVAHAVAQDIPVIVSMGPMAGSGGYWIAADATEIFAMPSTLTGSIGVASGKMDLSGLADKLGITWDGVTMGDQARLWSPMHAFTPQGDAKMNAMMDHLYEAFIERVATGRGMDKEAVDKIAKGRVWTGRQAKEIGLVDHLGGLGDAMDFMAQGLGLESRAQLNLVHLPRPKTPFDRILKLLDIEVMMNHVVMAVMQRIEKSAEAKVMVYDPVLGMRF